MIDNGDDNGSNDVYRRRVEPILVLLSNLYSEEKILVCDSRSFFCPTYTSYFYYCLKEFYTILS